MSSVPPQQNILASIEESYTTLQDGDDGLVLWSGIEESVAEELSLSIPLIREAADALIRERQIIIADAASADDPAVRGPPGYERRARVRLEFNNPDL